MYGGATMYGAQAAPHQQQQQQQQQQAYAQQFAVPPQQQPQQQQPPQQSSAYAPPQSIWQQQPPQQHASAIAAPPAPTHPWQQQQQQQQQPHTSAPPAMQPQAQHSYPAANSAPNYGAPSAQSGPAYSNSYQQQQQQQHPPAQQQQTAAGNRGYGHQQAGQAQPPQQQQQPQSHHPAPSSSHHTSPQQGRAPGAHPSSHPHTPNSNGMAATRPSPAAASSSNGPTANGTGRPGVAGGSASASASTSAGSSSSSSSLSHSTHLTSQRDLLSLQRELNSVPPGYPFTASAMGSALMGSTSSAAAAPAEPSLFGNEQFTEEESARIQLLLERKLAGEEMATRSGGGKAKLWYVETHQSINFANYIFDWNGWSSSIKEFTVDYMTEREGRWFIGISCIVRVQLKDGAYHEDVGYGTCANMPDRGAAIEKVKKEAASDALKRTLRLFGNGLGNCIYDKDYLAKLSKGQIVTQPLDLSLNRPRKRNRFMPMTKEEVQQQQQQQQPAPAHTMGAVAPAAHRPTPMADGMAASSSGAAAAAATSSYAAPAMTSGMNGGLPRSAPPQQAQPMHTSPKVSKQAYGQTPSSAMHTTPTQYGHALPSATTAPPPNPYLKQQGQAPGQGSHYSPVVKQETSAGSPVIGSGMRPMPPAPSFSGSMPQQQQQQQPPHPPQQAHASTAGTPQQPQPSWQASLQSHTAHSMGLGQPHHQQQQQQQQHQQQQQSHPPQPASHQTSSATAPSTLSAAASASLFPTAPAANQTYVPTSHAPPAPFSTPFGAGAPAQSKPAAPGPAAALSSASSRLDDDLDDDALLHIADQHSPLKSKEGASPNPSERHPTSAEGGVKRQLQMAQQATTHSKLDEAEERKELSPPRPRSSPYLTQQPPNLSIKEASPKQARILTSADLLSSDFDPDHTPLGGSL